MKNYIVTDNDGMPSASVDMDQITDQGTKLAFRLAAERNAAARQAIAAEAMTEAGTESFGFVAACAMQVLAGEILHPILKLVDAAGIRGVRSGIKAMSEGRHPKTGRPA